jgi:pilin isopeptide linkage protein/uncharacterized repeat protein (TIGR01451 family)
MRIRKKTGYIHGVLIFTLLCFLILPIAKAFALEPATTVVPVRQTFEVMNPAGLPVNDTFHYTLTPQAAGNPMPPGSVGGVYHVSLQGEEDLDITGLVYPSAGVYEYELEQVIPTNEGDYTYDTERYHICVYVQTVDEVLLAQTIIKNSGGDKVEAASFANKFTASGGEEDPDQYLSVMKIADQDSVGPNKTLSYTITLKNEGTETIQDLVIVDYLPTFTTYVSSDPAGKHAKNKGKETVTWVIASLEPGETMIMHLVLKTGKKIPEGHTFTNTLFYNGKLAGTDDTETITGTSNTEDTDYDETDVQTFDPSCIAMLAVAAFIAGSAVIWMALKRRRRQE